MRRSAAASIGKIAAARPDLRADSILAESTKNLVRVLNDTKESNDVRREAATALGFIGSSSAVAALSAAASSVDPYLAAAAKSSLKRLQKNTSQN